jgi:hypothetical protein
VLLLLLQTAAASLSWVQLAAHQVRLCTAKNSG